MGVAAGWLVDELVKEFDLWLVHVATAGMRESHVHDVQITKEAPNYRAE